MTTTVSSTKQQVTLYEMRQKSGKSGYAVARLCGTTYRSLRNWEIGVTIPNIVNICDLLQIYGYSFSDLDLTPFYANYQERTDKQKKADEEIDNPQRDRRQFEESLSGLKELEAAEKQQI